MLMPMVKAAFLAMNVTDDILHDPSVLCGGPGSKVRIGYNTGDLIQKRLYVDQAKPP